MNLLEDPVLSVEAPDRRLGKSLPQVYNLLFEDRIESFERLQAHQRQAWHSFLAQLGAVALEGQSVPSSADGWRELLLQLAPREAWSMHTEDLSKPAFMQPPVPEESISDWDARGLNTADVPKISRNHAIKARRSGAPNPEDWVYVLVNQNLTSYYAGRGNYGTVRINGGYAARPFMGTTPSLRWGPHLESDIRKLAGWRPTGIGFEYKAQVTPLLWTEPPAEEKSDRFDVEELHPLFIDCPKRFRFDGTDMRETTNACQRIEGVSKGVTGDPWAPLDGGSKVLNPDQRHFGYRKLSQILFTGDYVRPPLMDGETGYLVFQAVTGEQGNRPRCMRRVIPYPYPSDDVFGPETPVAEEAKARLERAGDVAGLLAAAMGELFDDQDRVNALVETFHDRVDGRFFDRLFEARELTDTAELRTFWDTLLFEIASDIFDQAKNQATAVGEKSRWQCLGEAQDIFLDLHSLLSHKS